MNVEITVPEEYIGDVIGDLNSRRGRVLGTDAAGHASVDQRRGAAGRDAHAMRPTSLHDRRPRRLQHGVPALRRGAAHITPEGRRAGEEGNAKTPEELTHRSGDCNRWKEGGLMSGHSKWSTIKHKKGKTDAKRGKLFSQAHRGDHGRGARGRRRPGHEPALCATPSRRPRPQHAQGQHRARHPARRRRGRGRAVREDRLRGLRPGRRGDPRRGADRQPQPHRRRGAPRVQQARRQPGASRRRRLVSSAGARSSSTAAKYDEDDLMAAALEAGAEDVGQDGDARGAHAARRLRRGARRARRRPASSSSSAELTMCPRPP